MPGNALEKRRLVKRKRRIEIRIERRELSVFSSFASNSSASDKSGAQEDSESIAAGPMQEKPDRCPTCGSTELMLLADAMVLASRDSLKAESPKRLIKFHLQCSDANEWWVCRPSLDSG
jgi:hypothetical protein